MPSLPAQAMSWQRSVLPSSELAARVASCARLSEGGKHSIASHVPIQEREDTDFDDFVMDAADPSSNNGQDPGHPNPVDPLSNESNDLATDAVHPSTNDGPAPP